MNRRSFLNKTNQIPVMSILGAPFLASSFNGQLDFKKKLIKPTGLKAGDTVGLVSPGFFASEEKLALALKQIKDLGLIPKKSKFLNSKFGYLAGTDEERASDLMDMFRDKNIKAIWCLRGGYGTARLLPLLDYKLIRKNPKLVIGYSDITALHCALLTQAGLISLHGPVASSTLTDYSKTNLLNTTFGNHQPAKILPASENIALGNENEDFKIKVLRPGRATGELVGGNLTLVSSLVGTPYQPNFKEKIVFLEDIGEKPYRIDRMLVQLLQGTNLAEAAAIVLGIFDDCRPSEGSTDYFTIHQVFEQLLKGLNIPLVYGYSFGHIDHQCSLPIGVKASLDTNLNQIQLLERPILD